MKKRKTITLSLMAAACALCLCFAFAGCGKDKEDDAAKYGYGEEGFYYYDGSDFARYMLSLQSGTYMMTVGGNAAYSGTYSYNGETDTVSFKGDEEFSASLGESALSLTMSGGGYSFKAYKFFEVTYVDETGKTVATESVLNGQCAENLDIEKDGYWFIDWYADAADSAVYSFDTSIAGDTTIYGWYIEKNAGATEHTITLDYGDGHTETATTTNGAVYRELPSSYGGRDIIGWWVSATNREGELTYRYAQGDVFDSDTTLFAVYAANSVLAVSVTKDGITWDTAYTGANVTVTVYDSDGMRVLSDTVSSSTGIFSSSAFTGLGTGKYTVEISSGNAKETRVYVVNGLPRVSLSEEGVIVNGSGRVLSFAPVEGADGYRITVTDGERTLTEDLGSRTYYNFSDWEMTREGITFAVTAYGEGRVESESNAYTYVKVLEGVTIGISDDVVSWNRVEGALEYVVTIKDVDGNVLDSFTTASTSFSLKYYESGTYDITVRPHTDGYWSEENTYYGYAKDSLAAPRVTDVTGYTVSWTEIAGADSYVVLINGTEYATGSGTTLAFGESNVPASSDGRYEISVKAVKNGGTDSPYGDAVVATEGFSSAVSYERNTVYWSYDIGATSYGISVNGGDETIITEGDSAKVTLTKAGDNVITVTAYRDGEAAGYAEATVYAYSVTLDPSGAELMNDAAVNGAIYVAQGDELNLGTVEKDFADFVGWYTQADYTDGQSDAYEGKGSEVEDGSVFTGSHGMYVYAYWTYRYVDVTLVLGDGKLSDGTSGTMTVSVKYNSSTGTLPVPVPDDDIDDFVGWFADPNGNGTQYTNGLGEWTDSPYMGESMLYASYLTIFAYTKTQYSGQTVYAVSINSQVNISRFDDITIPESYEGCSLILNADAFANCSTLVTINVPDTVLYISTTNDGYVMGTGAFSGCYNLQNVNIYATDGVSEPLYFSNDGVLFRKITSSSSGDAELVYYPYGRSLGAYTVPAVVCDECETDYTGAVVEHKVTSVATQVFKDRKISSITISCNVTTVSSQAFYSNPYLKEVYFEPGGTDGLTIASYAFINCTALTDVTLPSRCNSFDATAFEGCTVLERMFVEAGGTYSSTDDGTLLGDNGTTLVFYSTGRSGEVDISDISAGISKIEQNAFASNNKITSVVISKSVTEICASAFEGCKGITSLVFEGDDNSPDLTIRTRAFYGCVSLTSVVLPSNLTALYVDAFGGCISLTYVEYDARAESSASSVNFVDGAFGEGNHITTLKLGEHVPEMDFAAIFDGGLISKVIIDENNPYYISDEYGVVYGVSGYSIIYCPPAISGDYVVLDGVTSVESGIFNDKIYLTSVTIGAGVNTIADDAFDGCVSLAAIYVDDDNSNYGNAVTAAGEKDGILYKKEDGELVRLIYCPMSCVTADVTVTASVTSVAMGAFSGVTTLKSVSFENSGNITFEVVESGDDKGNANTFLNCTALTTVVLPESMTSVPAYMFSGCSSLKNIAIPSGVTIIEPRAFSGCSSLTGDLTDPVNGIKLPSGLLTIDERAFSGCGNLAVTIPNTVTHIGSYAFYQCWYTEDAKSEIVFEKGGTESLVISSYAFEYTIYCTGVEIPARATTVASYSFAYLGMSVYAEKDLNVRFEEGSKLETLTDCFRYMVIKEISIPASVKTVSANVFYNNASLESVTFETDENGESSLNSVADSVFATSKITSVELPASLTTIGKSTFATSTLEEVTFADGSQLKTIGETAFKGTAIKEMDIPSSVTSVGASAFAGCTKLEKVTFEDGGSSTLTKIGNSCFDGCTALTDVTLPGKLEQTGDGTASGIFNGCTALETITLPASVKTVTADTFSGCAALTTVVFESGSALATIGDEAFVGCESLSSAYTGSAPSEEGFVFPESTAATLSLGNAIFNGCTSLTHVTLSSNISDVGTAFVGSSVGGISVGNNTHYKVDDGGQILISLDGGTGDGNPVSYVFGTLTGDITGLDGVTSIGASAFAGQTGITSIVIPSSVKIVGDSAFYGCTGLKKVTFEDGVTSIGANVFYGCTALTDVNIPASITSIGANVFSGCTGITKIEIPAFITSVGEGAFSGCASLETVTFAEGCVLTNDSLGTGVFEGCSSLSSIALPAAITSIPDYFFSGCDLSDSSFNNITTVGQYSFRGVTAEKLTLTNVSSVGSYAFTECGCKVIELGSSLATLSDHAFYNSGIEEIVWPTAPKSIANFTFGGCASLKRVEIPSSVTTIGISAFNGCTSLEEVVIPNTVTSIGTSAFQNCSSLETVDLPSGLTSFGTSSFRDCSSLKSVVLPQNMTSLGVYCFQDCTSLESVQFDDELQTVDNSAFYGCSSLRTVTLPSKCTKIDGFAFCDCASLTYVYIDSAVDLSQKAFSGCTSLETVVLGPEVTFNGDNNDLIFENCTSLKEITLPVSVDRIPNSTFYGCTSLERILIPATVTYVGRSAFAGCGCDIFVENTADYASVNWSDAWAGTDTRVYFYSQDEPEVNGDGTAYAGDFWHYDDNFDIAVWTLKSADGEAVAPADIRVGFVEASRKFL